MSLQKEYQDLIQLTLLFLQQNRPFHCSVPPPSVSPSLSFKAKPATPVESRPSQAKESLKPVIHNLPIVHPNGLESIRELIKTHCPHYKLCDHPLQNLTQVLIVYDQEVSEEKELLQRIQTAVLKQGLTCLTLHVRDCPMELFHPQFVKVVIATQTVVDAHPQCQKAPLAIIPDLQLFIKEPTRRIEWWEQLMRLCSH